jgi:ABC-type polysaccharide/polyol phosphate export permease
MMAVCFTSYWRTVLGSFWTLINPLLAMAVTSTADLRVEIEKSA